MSLMVNIHDQQQFDHCQHNYTAVMKAVGNDGWKTNATLLCSFEQEAWSSAIHDMVLDVGEDSGIDYLWTDFGGAPTGESAPYSASSALALASSNTVSSLSLCACTCLI
jgi:hypothetical protein